ncbi:MAG: hydrogenase 3 maturation endopeptidase HyCI [Candidatus Bathyarchaeota archaeon]|nr:hydrogenase 3 maturation endopeptidase HyCI [Candidatus Bathyarchaeota archaeon]
MSLRAELEAFLGAPEGRRVVLVGIGSPMRHDDIVGLKVLEYLEGKTPRSVLLLPTETVPESYTGAIRDFQPTHVLLIDAANFNGAPGGARIIPPNLIANASVSTHSLPLHVLIGYIKKTICENVVLVGIQGVNIDMGEGLTPEVERGASEIAKMLLDLLNK